MTEPSVDASSEGIEVVAGGETTISKNQLKKLAQKAEKKNKQQQAKAAEGAAPKPSAEQSQALAGTTTTASQQPTPPAAAAPPTFTVAIPASRLTTSQSLVLLKIAAAWGHYGAGVDLGAVQNPEPCVELRCVLSTSEPWGGDAFAWRDGNAMVRAIAAAGSLPSSSSSNSGRSVHQSLVQDDWLEWERTLERCVVQEADPTSARREEIQGKLHELAESGLRSHSHVGDDFGPADVAILTTLSALWDEAAGYLDDDDFEIPASVVAYRHAHHSALERAQKDADRLVKRARAPQSLLRDLHGVFHAAIRQLYPDLVKPDSSATKWIPDYFISPTKSGDNDYQCSVAMLIVAALKKTSSGAVAVIPTAHEVAARLVEAVQSSPIVDKLQVVGPGFVCFNVSTSYLNEWITKALGKPALDVPSLEGQAVVVDFSSPNIAKEMHVGHLRSTIIGESVCRILESCGARVHRVNHVGDWGTQFGMLISHLQETAANAAGATSDEAGGQPNISDLTVFYKSAKERFDQDPDFKLRSQQNVVKLQAGDLECQKIWQNLCDISRREFEKVYQRLDVTLEECGESFYNSRIPAVIEEFDKAGLLELDQSARVVRISGHAVPLMLQKSDGGYGYDSTDMAALKYRLFDLKANRIIVITDFSQESHFQMVYKAGEMIGWVKDGAQRLQHIGFGTVMGDDGKRFKTRSGDTVRLVDLLDEAVSRMDAQLRDRIVNNKSNISLDEVQEVAEAIGYGALKYFDLRRNPKSNYKFSYDEMLDTKGDTAVYLLYARVRLESIMAKALKEHGVNVQDLLAARESIVLAHESERKLALALAKFTDVMEETLDDLFPCHICEYVYRVANAATDFVTQCKVLGSPEMKSRLLLCHFTASAIHQCFDLLGIRHVKRI